MANENMTGRPLSALCLVPALLLLLLLGQVAPTAAHAKPAERHSMMHNHLSRKVLERACAASKDTIDEIVACITNNETLAKSIRPDTATHCYQDAFGEPFDMKAAQKHKELICKNRDKFETMTTCIYKSTSETLDPKQMDKLTETLVDVGLCIVNALDG